MTVSLIVPVEGIAIMFNYPINPAREMQKIGTSVTVAVGLESDGLPVGRLLYDHAAPDRNPRATDVTALLCGAFVQVMGDAMFDGLTEEWAVKILEEVL